MKYQHPDPVTVKYCWILILHLPRLPLQLVNRPWCFWCFESITVIFAYPLPFLKYRHLPRRICRWFWVCWMWGCPVQTSQVCICLKVSDVSKFATPENPPYCVLWRFAALLFLGQSLCFISVITHERLHLKTLECGVFLCFVKQFWDRP